MKPYFLLLLPFLFTSTTAKNVFAQEPSMMVRLYEDNDLINIWGKGTDKAYSNGSRVDLFYEEPKALNSFVYELMPRAGDSSRNTLGWSLMQIMITPTNISDPTPEAGDHHYSGSLFGVHSLHSVNPKRKLGMQSEWVVGVMGPPALAGETQIFIHRLIGSQRPMGWARQLPADLLLNYNLTMEKGWLQFRDAAELFSGMQVFTGTMHTGAALYTTLRFGQLLPHFSGFIGQHAGTGRKLHWYGMLRPSVELTVYNALLEGGFFSDSGKNDAEMDMSTHVRHLVTRCDFGFGFTASKWSVSFTQKSMSSMIKGLPDHSVGNISVAYGW